MQAKRYVTTYVDVSLSPLLGFAVFFTLATFILTYPSFIHVLYLSATFIPSPPSSLSPFLSLSLPPAHLGGRNV